MATALVGEVFQESFSSDEMVVQPQGEIYSTLLSLISHTNVLRSQKRVSITFHVYFLLSFIS